MKLEAQGKPPEIASVLGFFLGGSENLGVLSALETDFFDTKKLNLFAEFRNDKNARAVTNRAKSILACSSEFFSATSPHQRIREPELNERLARVLVETMLEPREGACLTVTQACDVFCRLSQQRQFGTLKRSMFRELMRSLVREHHGLSLRHDVPDAQNRHQQAWRGLAGVEADVLAA